MKTIADRLKEARLAKNLTQEDLARAAGVTQSTIGNIEAGTRKNPRELLAIASALDVDPTWLKTGKAITLSSSHSSIVAAFKAPEGNTQDTHWPIRSISAADYAQLPRATQEQIEAFISTVAGLPPPIDWRTSARRLAASVDKQLKTEHYTEFVNAVEKHHDELATEARLRHTQEQKNRQAHKT